MASYLDVAKKVLEKADAPLSAREICERIEASKLGEGLVSSGDALRRTLRVILSEDSKKENSTVISIGKRRVQYFLKSREDELPEEFSVRKILVADVGVGSDESNDGYPEGDLHRLLAYFVHSSPGFFGNKKVYTKTIRHEKSRKTGYTQLVHPDMVGVYFPFLDLEKDVFDLSQKIQSGAEVKLFSFELKKVINKGTYKKSLYQVASNSSWAHEGYLVAAEISADVLFRQELKRLTDSLGIGIIHLNVKNVASSNVLFDASRQTELGWDTINKLCKINPNFTKFIHQLNIDIGAGQVHVEKYDSVPKDPPTLKQRLKTVK